jgi:hypothetical protein
MATGELSKDQLKDAEKLLSMGSVIDRNYENRSGEFEIMEINFTSKQEGLGDIYVRVAVEVTDKQKETYLVEEAGKYPDDFGNAYAGEGHWKLDIPYGSFRRLKISGYAIEFGLMDGKEFVPFDADYDDVKTYEELTARTTTPFSGECKFGLTYMVEN